MCESESDKAFERGISVSNSYWGKLATAFLKFCNYVRGSPILHMTSDMLHTVKKITSNLCIQNMVFNIKIGNFSKKYFLLLGKQQ